MSRELHLVRRIRNDFAHNVTGCNFTDGSIQSRVVELTKSQDVPKSQNDYRKTLPEGPRGDFQITCSWLSWQLWSFLDDVEAFSPEKDFRAQDLINSTESTKKAE
jgi:hypothetical protein